mgnify:CR=1 FL=1
MLSTMMELFAYGPIGGIDPGVAIKWVIIWTVVLGGMLYASLFAKPWPDLDDH